MTRPRLLGIIPARGGSKGIPRKNIISLSGKPLIAYTIESCRASGVIDRLIVSTDCQEIADVSRLHGAEVPFLRPAELSQDDTAGVEPILHALRFVEAEGDRPDWVACLQPTSPLRTAVDIREAFEMALRIDADAVISVTPAKTHPFWLKTLSADGRLLNYSTPHTPIVRRQDLPPVYAANGAIYLVRRDVLLEQRTLWPEGTYAYVMPPDRSVDVDTEFDLCVAAAALDGVTR